MKTTSVKFVNLKTLQTAVDKFNELNKNIPAFIKYVQDEVYHVDKPLSCFLPVEHYLALKSNGLLESLTLEPSYLLRDENTVFYHLQEVPSFDNSTKLANLFHIYYLPIQSDEKIYSKSSNLEIEYSSIAKTDCYNGLITNLHSLEIVNNQKLNTKEKVVITILNLFNGSQFSPYGNSFFSFVCKINTADLVLPDSIFIEVRTPFSSILVEIEESEIEVSQNGIATVRGCVSFDNGMELLYDQNPTKFSVENALNYSNPLDYLFETEQEALTGRSLETALVRFNHNEEVVKNFELALIQVYEEIKGYAENVVPNSYRIMEPFCTVKTPSDEINALLAAMPLFSDFKGLDLSKEVSTKYGKHSLISLATEIIINELSDSYSSVLSEAGLTPSK